jgi:hypothetical protein
VRLLAGVSGAARAMLAATATIDPSRAHVDCNATLNVTSDGPITITLAGCNRSVQAG